MTNQILFPLDDQYVEAVPHLQLLIYNLHEYYTHRPIDAFHRAVHSEMSLEYIRYEFNDFYYIVNDSVVEITVRISNYPDKIELCVDFKQPLSRAVSCEYGNVVVKDSDIFNVRFVPHNEIYAVYKGEAPGDKPVTRRQRRRTIKLICSKCKQISAALTDGVCLVCEEES